MDNPNVKSIVKEHLSKNGYDGLFSEDGECACVIDDLSPGDCLIDSCESGYKTNCHADCDEAEEHGFHISRNKE